MATENAGARINPYVGPRALESGEALFGRDDETVDLLNQVIADRVVLVYAVSGAGKTSLLRAGLLPGLESRGFIPLPIVQVRDERPAGSSRNRYTASVLQRLEVARPAGERLEAAQLEGMTLQKYLAVRFPDGLSDRVLIFDQFEDLLRIDTTDVEVKEEFFKDVGTTLRAAGLRAVFSLREEYVPGLDPYLKHLPTRLTSRFRLALLSEKAAKEAVCGPAAEAGVPFQQEVADDLVRQLRLVQVQRPNGAVDTVEGPNVEPVQLQVVCQLLWERKAPGAKAIGPEALAGFSVDQALELYFSTKAAAASDEAKVNESLVRRWVEDKLITSQRLRGQVLKGNPDTEGLANTAIEGLVSAYIVRAEQRLGGIWFELTHDRLVDPIRQNNRKWFAKRFQPFQLQADQWTMRTGGEKDSLLLNGLALVDAEQWAAKNPGEIRKTDEEFLEKSRNARTARDRIRTALYRGWATLSTLALCAGVVLVWWALSERKKAYLAVDAATNLSKFATQQEVVAKNANEMVKQQKSELNETSIQLRQSTGKQKATYEVLQEVLLRLIDQLASQSSRLSTSQDREVILIAGFAWECLYNVLLPEESRRPKEFQRLMDYMQYLRKNPKERPDPVKQHQLSLGLSQNLQRALDKDNVIVNEFLPLLRARYYTGITFVLFDLIQSGDAGEKRQNAREKFEEYYWVKLPLVESSGVSKAMVAFRANMPPDDKKPLTKDEATLLKGLADEVVKQCKDDLLKNKSPSK